MRTVVRSLSHASPMTHEHTPPPPNARGTLQVSILEPNNMKTPMLEAVPRRMAQTFDALPADTKAKYGEAFFQARWERTRRPHGVER